MYIFRYSFSFCLDTKTAYLCLGRGESSNKNRLSQKQKIRNTNTEITDLVMKVQLCIFGFRGKGQKIPHIKAMAK